MPSPVRVASGPPAVKSLPSVEEPVSTVKVCAGGPSDGAEVKTTCPVQAELEKVTSVVAASSAIQILDALAPIETLPAVLLVTPYTSRHRCGDTSSGHLAIVAGQW